MGLAFMVLSLLFVFILFPVLFLCGVVDFTIFCYNKDVVDLLFFLRRSCIVVSEADFEKVFGWMEQEYNSFAGVYKDMPGPKYKKGDVVKFEFFSDRDPLEGMIEIVDRFGTFEQNEEPSYDVYRFEDNTLYKHVRESLVTEYVREGSIDEIDENIKKFL